MPDAPNQHSIVAAEPEPPVQIILEPRTLRMFRVTAEEIDSLLSSRESMFMGLAGIAAGGFIATLVVLLTVSTLTVKAFAGFVAACIVSGAISAVLGLLARSDHRRSQQAAAKIKAEITGSPLSGQ